MTWSAHSLLKPLSAALGLLAMVSARADGDEASLCLNSREAPAQTISHCSAANENKTLPDERRAAVLTQRGLASMAKRDLDHARADFDAAIALNGSSYWSYNSRAVLWMQLGDADRAIADGERAVELNPRYAFAWANLGNARLVHGDVDPALAALDKAIQLAPERMEIPYTSRGRAWLARGDCAQARADFNAALQANGRYANALSGRGYAQFCSGDFEAAAADFRSERVLRKDGESAMDLLIAVRRSGHDGQAELAEARSESDPATGMATGLALFSGTITPEQALQAISDRDPRVQRLRSCSASFEVGEWYLLKTDVPRARQYLAQARETCDPSLGQYAAAGAELARLK